MPNTPTCRRCPTTFSTDASLDVLRAHSETVHNVPFLPTDYIQKTVSVVTKPSAPRSVPRGYSPELVGLLQQRISDAIANGRDPTNAALSALFESELQKVPFAQEVLAEVRRVEIHRGSENVYKVHMQRGLDDAIIEIDQKELADSAKAFSERYLQHFNTLLVFPKGTWPIFVDALLGSENVVRLEYEDMDEGALLIEAFTERVQRYKIVDDIALSVREADHLYWEPDTDLLLLRTERVKTFLKSQGADMTMTIGRFGLLLKEHGIVVRESFQRKITPTNGKGKAQVLRFWRLDPKALGVTKLDIGTKTPTDLPPDLPNTDDATEGTG